MQPPLLVSSACGCHSILMQEDTPNEVPMAVRIAINSWMPYFTISFFVIIVKV